MTKQVTPEEHAAMQTSSQPARKPLTSYVPTALAAIIILALGFVGGMQYQKGKQPTAVASGQFGNQQMGQGQQNGFPGGGGPSGAMRGAFGTVSAVSDTSITVTSRRTSQATTYSISSSTKIINNGTTASVSDIKQGDSVVIEPDSSDSKQAAQVMLNPQMPGRQSGSGQMQDDSTI